MKLRIFLTTVVAILAFNNAFGQSSGEKDPPQTNLTGASGHVSDIPLDKVLVTFNTLPPEGGYEVIGQINVYKRWFGGLATSRKLLADRARELGANAVVESRVWLAPAFPAQVAPHGSGIAVRVTNPEVLQALVDDASSWE